MSVLDLAIARLERSGTDRYFSVVVLRILLALILVCVLALVLVTVSIFTVHLVFFGVVILVL